MVYLLDTNIFRELLEHFPKRGKMFEEIWKQFEQGIKDGSILSIYGRTVCRCRTIIDSKEHGQVYG